ncbi:MAG: dephospho-CoA kinase [Verrucomicrobiota bacterium]|jgi:dephospho-CoA kinase
MKLIGVTGGVGMGKSTSGAWLQKRGMPVADADAIARQLVEPGQPALAEITRAFGPSVISPEGGLDRRELARRIFADPAERAKLEAILHPKIRQVWQAEAEKWRASGCAAGAVVIPLLFETKAECSFDTIICVACCAASQFERLRERGWSGAEIRQRLAAQWHVEEKIARADFVIWTDTTLEAHAAQLEKGLAKILTSSTTSGAPV